MVVRQLQAEEWKDGTCGAQGLVDHLERDSSSEAQHSGYIQVTQADLEERKLLAGGNNGHSWRSVDPGQVECQGQFLGLLSRGTGPDRGTALNFP